MVSRHTRQSGFSFVEALIVAAVGVTIFAGLFSTFSYTFELLGNAKAKTTAVTLANQRMEYFRSLPYNSVGTIAGIPPGTIPQNSTTTMNNITFSERVLVEFVDDPADGLLTATTTDSNGIPADYKRVKIEISWTLKGITRSVFLTSNIVPRSIETTDGGGTIRVNVLDADANPLGGVAVQLLNNTTTSTIDVTKNTDSNGVALFSGAPAASNYQVVVTAPGFSTDRTYVPSVANPNPVTVPFAVLESDISTVTFQIDELSDIDITTYSSVTDEESKEEFFSGSGVAISSNTEVASGVLRLQQSGGVYSPSGQAILVPVNPSPNIAWGVITVARNIPAGTGATMQVGTLSSSTFTPIPDSVLPGNATGFTSSVIDISSLPVVTYPALAVQFSLSTGNTAVTPQIDEVAFYYREVQTPRTGVALTLQGNKIIGTNASAQPIHKTVLSGTTDGVGMLTFGDVEFDTYQVTIPSGLELETACPSSPFVHRAGVPSSIELVLRAAVPHSLRVTVLTDAGLPIPGADVSVTRSGFSQTLETNLCGQVFVHSGVVEEFDYEVTVSKPGFSTQTITGVVISGNRDVAVTLVP